MYKTITLLFFLVITNWLNAQKVLTEGTIKMEITDVNSDDPQMAMQMEMMKGSSIEIFFKNHEYITAMNMMGGLMIMKNQIQEKENKMNLFMDMMGQKFWIESSLDEARTAEQKELAAKSQITYDKNDKKVILGYNCYKMIVQNPEMLEGMEVSGYVTEEIVTGANVIQGLESVKFQGFPLEYTVKNNMFSMKMESKTVSDKVDASNFTMDTTGYKKMTMKEFQESFGNMGF